MWSEWRCVRKTFVTSAGLIAILAIPVVRLRPASKRSLSEPASMSVLMPSRWASNVGPPWVPSRTTRMLELAPDGRACCDPTRGAAANRMRSRDAVFMSPSRPQLEPQRDGGASAASPLLFDGRSRGVVSGAPINMRPPTLRTIGGSVIDSNILREDADASSFQGTG